MIRPLLPGLLALLLFAASGCCTPTACLEENLPTTSTLRTPEDTVRFFQYCCRHECYGRAYDTLSKRTQEEVGRWTFIAFFPSEEVPNSDQKIRDLIVGATYEGTMRHEDLVNPEGEEVELASAFLSNGDWLQQVLLFPEPDPDDPTKVQWKLGLMESFEYGLFQNAGGRTQASAAGCCD